MSLDTWFVCLLGISVMDKWLFCNNFVLFFSSCWFVLFDV